MKRYGLALAIGLVLVVNAIVFAGVVYNRGGNPDATLALTEREVPLAWAKKENTGLFLKFNWEMSGAYQYEDHKIRPNWLDESKMKELGFDFPIPASDPKANEYYGYYGKNSARRTFIVLEYGGKSWQSWLQDNQKDLQIIADKIKNEDDAFKKKNLEKNLKQRERFPLVKSRLFAIDAGNDPARLRQKYSSRDQFIITRGVVKVTYISRKYGILDKNGTRTYVQGRIQHLFPMEIFVPNSYRKFFSALKSSRHYSYYYVPEDKPDSEILPQYELTLKFGRKYEAWIANVKLLKQKL